MMAPKAVASHALCLALIALLPAAVHGGQDEALTEQEIPPTLAAARALGLKAEGVRRRLAVAPVVVICPDEASCLEAISAWSPRLRFPVLIDDGSHSAAADIARFVRAFEPDEVLWFEAATEEAEKEERDAGERIDDEAFRARAEAALARAWGVRPQDDTVGEPRLEQALLAWEAMELHPFGVVACDPADPCRIAAVALAAGRGQPIVWLDAPRGVNRAMDPEQCRGMSDAIAAALDAINMQWDGLGAGIDAVTLVAEAPVRIEGGPETLATTDALGRDPDDPMQRWAWAGQIFGDPAQAAYRAMCGLFLRADTAWLFDGYPNEAPWAQYDQSTAALVLRQAGLEVTIDDDASATLASWRSRLGLGIDAHLIFVNSKGNKARFDLPGGQAHAADVPFLMQPAAVYFIHSWSATQPKAQGTVAGKWLNRGAYAYFGSVSEPYLQSFVPPANVAARLGAGLPLGAAARPDESPPWKLAMLGDPLITFGAAPPAADAEPDLSGAEPLEDRMRRALGMDPPDLAAAVRTLTMLGRDDEAAQLVAATLREQPARVDAELADTAITALHAARDRKTLGLIARLTSDERRAGALDALWHLAARHLRATDDANLAATMAASLREHMLASDAEQVAQALRRVRGGAAAMNFLQSVRQRATREQDQQAIDKLLEQFGR